MTMVLYIRPAAIRPASMTTVSAPTTFRANIRATLLQPFFQDLSLDETAMATLVGNIEKSVYNWSIQEARRRNVVRQWNNSYFVTLYVDRLRSVYMNMTPAIVAKIHSGEIKAQDIAFMTHQELNPERWAELIRVKSIRDQNKFEDRMEASTDTFKCKKCKSTRCSYYALQTRSADEPMTLFVTCLDCGHRFRR